MPYYRVARSGNESSFRSAVQKPCAHLASSALLSRVALPSLWACSAWVGQLDPILDLKLGQALVWPWLDLGQTLGRLWSDLGWIKLNLSDFSDLGWTLVRSWAVRGTVYLVWKKTRLTLCTWGHGYLSQKIHPSHKNMFAVHTSVSEKCIGTKFERIQTRGGWDIRVPKYEYG